MFREIEESWTNDAQDYDDIVKRQLADQKSVSYWSAELARILGSTPLRILDVGCGPGFLTIILTRLGHQVEAIDGASGMVTCANSNFRAEGIDVTAREEDAVLLPDETAGSYDVIISRDVVWTLYDPQRAFARWHEVLKKGGRVLYYDGSFRDWRTEARLRAWKKLSAALIFLTEGGKIYREDVDVPEGAFADLPFYAGADRPRMDMEALQAAGFRRIRTSDDIYRNSLRRLDRWKYGYAGRNFRVLAVK